MAATTHNGLADVDDLALACSNDFAYIVWRDNYTNGVDDTVWLSIFDINNEVFTAQDINVSPNLVAAGGDADDGLAVAVDENFLAILYHADNLGGTAEQVRVNLSADLGLSWSGDQQVGLYDNAVANHDADNGTLLVEDGFVAVAWQDNRSGQDEVYVTYANMLLGAFVPDVQCSNSATGSGPPQLSGEFNGEPLAVAWTETPGRVLKAKYMRNWSWSPSFLISANAGDVSNARMSWNDLYDNFSLLWLTDDTVVQQAVVGGFRAHQVSADPITAGGVATFNLTGFGPGRTYQVAASGSLGTLPLPDGRNLGLTYDTILQITKNLSPLRGVISGSGSATTAPVTVPPNLAGSTIYLIAVSFNNGGDFQDLSDTVAVTVQ